MISKETLKLIDLSLQLINQRLDDLEETINESTSEINDISDKPQNLVTTQIYLNHLFLINDLQWELYYMKIQKKSVSNSPCLPSLGPRYAPTGNSLIDPPRRWRIERPY